MENLCNSLKMFIFALSFNIKRSSVDFSNHGYRYILFGRYMDSALTYQAYYTKSNPILNYMTGMLHFKPHDRILEPCGGMVCSLTKY